MEWLLNDAVIESVVHGTDPDEEAVQYVTLMPKSWPVDDNDMTQPLAKESATSSPSDHVTPAQQVSLSPISIPSEHVSHNSKSIPANRIQQAIAYKEIADKKIGEVWRRAQALLGNRPSPVLNIISATESNPAENVIHPENVVHSEIVIHPENEDQEGHVESKNTNSDTIQELSVPAPKFRDLLEQLFPFDRYPESYCAFGSFRRLTSSLGPFARRPLEVIPVSVKPDKTLAGRLDVYGPPAHFKDHFAVYSSVGSESRQRAGPDGASQFFMLSAGPHFHNLRAWCVCRGHGGQGGFLVDWVTFSYARRLLGGIFSALGDGTSNQSQSVNQEAKSSQTSNIRNFIKIIHSELYEDYLSTFGEISHVAPLTLEDDWSHTEDIVMKTFGESGVVVHSGVAIVDFNCLILSSLGDIPACIGSRRRLPARRRDSSGRRPSFSKTPPSCGVVTPLFSSPHTMSQTGEKHRVAIASTRAFQKALENDIKKCVDNNIQSGKLQKRILAAQRARVRWDVKKECTPPDGSPQVDAGLDSVAALDPVSRSPTKRIWIEKAIAQSPIGRYGVTRGIGFLSACHLGLVGVPDFVELPLHVSVTPMLREPRLQAPQEETTKRFSNQLSLSRQPPVPSFTRNDLDDCQYIASSGKKLLLLKHFLLIFSSSKILKFLSMQEAITFIYNQVEYEGMSLQAALRALSKHVRRILLQNINSPAAHNPLEEEITFLCIPLQTLKISPQDFGP